MDRGELAEEVALLLDREDDLAATLGDVGDADAPAGRTTIWLE